MRNKTSFPKAAEDLEIQFVDLCQAIQTIEEVLRS